MEKKKSKFKIFAKNRIDKSAREFLDSNGFESILSKNVSPEERMRAKFYIGSEIFAEKVREYEHKYPFKKAIKLATKYCIEKNILKEYLKENSSRILNMMLKARADCEAGVPMEESRKKFEKEFE